MVVWAGGGGVAYEADGYTQCLSGDHYYSGCSFKDKYYRQGTRSFLTITRLRVGCVMFKMFGTHWSRGNTIFLFGRDTGAEDEVLRGFP
jgi:hypothetical protein